MYIHVYTRWVGFQMIGICSDSAVPNSHDGSHCDAAAPCPSSPNAYTLALRLALKMQCSPTVNVDRLKPLHTRADDPPAPGQVSDPGHEGY